MKALVLFLFIFLYLSCDSSIKVDSDPKEAKSEKKIEAITLLGDTLFSSPSTNEVSLQNFEEAKSNYESDPKDLENIIWYGRRTAYLGRYNDAIAIYGKGLEIHKDNARLLRHRGHRYISTRQYDKAIADFERASEMIVDTPNQIEQDGIPNAQNTPISSLHGNIYYHLALAYYLQNDLENAERVYQKRITTHQNDDNIVSAGHWHYMTLRRLGKTDEAIELLEAVKPEMDIIENMHYHNMCLYYKGLIEKEELKTEDENGRVNEVFLYGLGNWEAYENQDFAKANEYFQKILKDGNKASFAYLAAESDLSRMRE